MRIDSAHAAVVVSQDLHLSPLVFDPVGDGRYEGEVPDEVGRFLLSISRPGEYMDVTVPPEPLAGTAGSPEDPGDADLPESETSEYDGMARLAPPRRRKKG